MRIYAASSEYEGSPDEVEPNPPNSRFIAWWESHWSEIMAYEPQYERLNQLMKWSTVIAWLELKESQALAFLDKRAVDRSEGFANWLAEHRGVLRFGGELPFVDVTNGTCLQQLFSETFRCGGSEDAWLSGGVSPASSSELEEMINSGQLPSDIQEDIRSIHLSGEGRILPLSGTEYVFSLSEGAIEATPSVSLSGVAFWGDWVEVDGAEALKLSFAEQSNGYRVVVGLGDASMGRLSVTQEGQQLVVDYQPEATLIAQSIVEEIGRASTPESLQRTCPLLRQIAFRKDIRSAFELADESVLVETSGGRWIHVGESVIGSIRSGISDKQSLEPHVFAAAVVDRATAEKLLGTEAIELEEYLVREVRPQLREREAGLILVPNRAALATEAGPVLQFPFDTERLTSQDELVLAALAADPSRPGIGSLQPAADFLRLVVELSGNVVDTVFVGSTNSRAAVGFGAMDQYVKVIRWRDPKDRLAHIKVIYDQPMVGETVEGFDDALHPTASSTAILAHGCGGFTGPLESLSSTGATTLLAPTAADYAQILGNSRYDNFIVIAPRIEATPLHGQPGLLDAISSKHVAVSFLIPESWDLTSEALTRSQVELVLYSTGELRTDIMLEVAYHEVEALRTAGDLYAAAMEAWVETLRAHSEIADWETLFVEYLKVRCKG